MMWLIWRASYYRLSELNKCMALRFFFGQQAKNQELSSTLSDIRGEAIIVDIEAVPRGADRAYNVKPPEHRCDWNSRGEITTGLRPRPSTYSILVCVKLLLRESGTGPYWEHIFQPVVDHIWLNVAEPACRPVNLVVQAVFRCTHNRYSCDVDDRAVGPYCKAPGCIIFSAHSKSRMAVLVNRRETVRKRMVRTRRVLYVVDDEQPQPTASSSKGSMPSKATGNRIGSPWA
jgi:hypothetical protein